MVDVHDRRIAPWVWVAIVLLAVILIFVVWWAVAAQSPGEVVVVPGPDEPAAAPQQEQPAQPAQPAQPVVVQPQPPVNIYIDQRQSEQPRAHVVPEGQQPPQAAREATRVDLPGAFRYQDRTWTASDEAVTRNGMRLRDTGVTVDGRPIHAQQDDTPPYESLYLETSPGSGVFLRYE